MVSTARRPPRDPSSRPFVGLLRLFGALAVVFLSVATIVGPAAAETPSQVVEEAAIDGVFVATARQRQFDESMFTPVVARAKDLGVTLIVAVPFEAEPNTTAFARRVREAADVDVAIVFGPDVEFGADVAEELEDGEVRAINAAREAVDPVAQVDAYLLALTTEPVRTRPAIIGKVVNWVIVLLLVLLIAAGSEHFVKIVKRIRRRATLRRSRSLS